MSYKVRQEDKDYQIADTHRDMYVLYCEKKLTKRNLREIIIYFKSTFL